MEQEIDIEVLVAGPQHEVYVDTILNTIAEAAKVRGTGIAKRTHEYLTKKMMEAKAVIALTKDGRFAGFSYIETWENQQYVTTSGLIVHPDFRGHHVAKRIKDMTFTLARTAGFEKPLSEKPKNCGYEAVTIKQAKVDELVRRHRQRALKRHCG